MSSRTRCEFKGREWHDAQSESFCSIVYYIYFRTTPLYRRRPCIADAPVSTVRNAMCDNIAAS